jgi:two-component system phosphate regulon sensor histidine kinase PhoR
VSVRLDTAEQVIRRPLRLYFVIVAFYGLLMAWWVYFFFNLDDRLVQRMEGGGVPLSASQLETLEHASAETMRMLIFEGGFLGLLMLLSVFLVMRAVERETTLARQQRNFVSAVTHELRSPLASARLCIDSILMRRTDAAKTERYLKHAREDIDRLGDMIEDILLTRRMGDRRIEVEPELLDLSERTEVEVGRLRELHAGSGVTLDLRTPGPVPVSLDPLVFPQMLDNLVSNAVKYGGDNGSVELSVEALGRFAVLAVRDHGPGLGGVDPGQLVEPFVRGGEEQVRTRPGVGLGLYIVCEFARAHGGKLTLEDGLPGGGTRASVTFPRAATHEVGRASDPEAAA